jgi:hypothetical protein
MKFFSPDFLVFSLHFFLLSSQEISTFFLSPLGYAGISSIFLSSTSSFYYHSGLISENTFSAGIQTFFYDPLADSWRLKPGDNEYFPPPRVFYGSFLYENNFYYIFGGIGPNGVYKDLWSYDISNDVWAEVSNSGPVTRRYSFAYCSFQNSGKTYFAVLGGKTNVQSDDLFDFYL